MLQSVVGGGGGGGRGEEWEGILESFSLISSMLFPDPTTSVSRIVYFLGSMTPVLHMPYSHTFIAQRMWRK